ncbi:MAG TPA: hypothetical protein PLU46_11210, partial [Thiotrichales bacterium]|nr:hypothetical protein [Thiotrichales bacterium]
GQISTLTTGQIWMLIDSLFTLALGLTRIIQSFSHDYCHLLVFFDKYYYSIALLHPSLRSGADSECILPSHCVTRQELAQGFDGFDG